MSYIAAYINDGREVYVLGVVVHHAGDRLPLSFTTHMDLGYTRRSTTLLALQQCSSLVCR